MKLTLLLVILGSILLAACSSNKAPLQSKGPIKDIWLNSYRDNAGTDSYVAQFGAVRSEEDWETLLLPIEGFRYTAGQIYHLRVEELGVNSDGEMQYRLDEIISQEPDPVQKITDIYVLRAIPGVKKSSEMKDIRCMFEIFGAQRTISGQGLCNSFNGNITTLTESDMTIGPIMATKRACPQLKIEKEVFKRLSMVRTYKRDGLLLLLQNEAGETLLELGKVD